jgi:3-hydroxybutyryl-CoA dehydrogenase
MNSQVVSSILVVGAGTMGHGIAEVAAINGYKVFLVDVAESILDRAKEKMFESLQVLRGKNVVKEDVRHVLSRIKLSTSLEESSREADMMIESVPEKIELKREIFERVEGVINREAILATNTSSIPISEIASSTKREDKVIGTHFFNSPITTKSVEVIKGSKTSEDTLRRTLNVLNAMRKVSILVKKDAPGFISSRIYMRLVEEACREVEEGEYTMREIDNTLIRSVGFPMGIFELMDYTGIDTVYLIIKEMKSRGFKIRECKTIENLLESGDKGVKTGKGFYSYTPMGKLTMENVELKNTVEVEKVLSSSINEASSLIQQGVASKYEIDLVTKLGFNFKAGLLEIADRLDMKKLYNHLISLYERGQTQYKPTEILSDMVENGLKFY